MCSLVAQHGEGQESAGGVHHVMRSFLGQKHLVQEKQRNVRNCHIAWRRDMTWHDVSLAFTARISGITWWVLASWCCGSKLLVASEVTVDPENVSRNSFLKFAVFIAGQALSRLNYRFQKVSGFPLRAGPMTGISLRAINSSKEVWKFTGPALSRINREDFRHRQ